MNDKASSEPRVCWTGFCNGKRQRTWLTDTLNGIPVQPGKVARCCAVCLFIIAIEDAPADWVRGAEKGKAL